MPRITPCHWKKQVAVFRYLGFTIQRQSSSHVVMKREDRPTRRPVVIPKYDSIGVEIILNNIRSAEITREEYLDSLENI